MGTTISSSALYVTQLAPGSYPVRITLANYQPYTVTAVVTAGGVYDIRANLVPVTPGPTPNTNGQITVRSNPSGANIYLDNAYRGLTPLTLVDIPQGSHTITPEDERVPGLAVVSKRGGTEQHRCIGNARRQHPPANPDGSSHPACSPADTVPDLGYQHNLRHRDLRCSSPSVQKKRITPPFFVEDSSRPIPPL